MSRSSWPVRALGWAAIGAACACVACRSSAAPPAAAVFVVDVLGEQFRVLVRDEAHLAQARRILSGAEAQKVVAGRLAAGNGSFNTGWSWHLLPETVDFTMGTIELCDGRPSFVESALDYWLNTVKTFCPWQGRLVTEERPPAST